MTFPAWVCILLLFPIIVLAICLHFYYVSRVLDGWYAREGKPMQERVETLEGQLRELTI